MTEEEARMEFKRRLLEMNGSGRLHFGTCTRRKGPRGGITEKVRAVRLTGQCKTWKTRPQEFRQPVKYGMYESGYVDEYTYGQYHFEDDCPLVQKGEQGDKGGV